MLNPKIKKIKITSKTGFIEKVRYLDEYYLNKLFQVTKNEEIELDDKSKKIILNYLRKNFIKFDKIFIFDYGYFSVFKDMLKLLNKNRDSSKNLLLIVKVILTILDLILPININLLKLWLWMRLNLGYVARIEKQKLKN